MNLIIAIVFTIIGLTPSFANAADRTRVPHYSIPVTSAPIPIPIPTPTPAPAPTPSPTPPPTPATGPVDFATQVEQLVVQSINAQRTQNRLAPLAADSKLATIARAHSLDMLTKNYFSHTDLNGCTVACRLAAVAYGWSSYGENIHWVSGYNLSAADTAIKIVSDWMNSPGHRANILGSSFTRIGVGMAVQGSKVYTTADFVLPR